MCVEYNDSSLFTQLPVLCHNLMDATSYDLFLRPSIHLLVLHIAQEKLLDILLSRHCTPTQVYFT